MKKIQISTLSKAKVKTNSDAGHYSIQIQTDINYWEGHSSIMKQERKNHDVLSEYSPPSSTAW
jgi:hypothetical protein